MTNQRLFAIGFAIAFAAVFFIAWTDSGPVYPFDSFGGVALGLFGGAIAVALRGK